MRHRIAAVLTVVLMIFTAASAPAQTIEVSKAFIKSIDDVEVPAREAGVLVEVLVVEGDRVEQGQFLAKTDDADAVLAVEKARIEVQIARQKAEDETAIEYAVKSLAVAEKDLQRAERSVEAVPGSVSLAEREKLRLLVERHHAEIQQARIEQQIAKTEVQLKEAELAIAERAVERRRIVSPIAGIVTRVQHRRGEWVEPGEMVLQILRTDRVRAEGFVTASQASHALVGSLAMINLLDANGRPIALDGEIVFVSPEIEPISNQVRIWAEFDNPDDLLRPGMRLRMVIDPATKP
ncbi:MAG: efflux RND transporter periplasmic adaptor subunit [Planctomycetaceae bacterium]